MSFKLDPKIKNSIYTSGFITAILLMVTTITLFRVQPEVPIFYSLPRSGQQLASKFWLLLFPVLSLIISVSHFLIIRFLRNFDKIVLELFVWSTVVVQILLALSLLRIIIIIS